MKILFDHQTYVVQDYGGISRYFYEISKGLIADFNVDVVNTVRLTNNIYTQDPIFKSSKFLPNTSFKGKGRILKFVNELYSEAKLGGDFDVFHPTYYDNYFLDSIKNKPFVLTVFDLTHEKFKHVFKDLQKEEQLLNMKKILLEKSSKIIAISKNTKIDIIDIYKIPESKIDVIYLGNSIENYDNYGAKTTAIGNYILYVGKRQSYKNFNVFLEAITPLLLKEKELKIVCAGGGKFNMEEMILFKKNDLISRIDHVEANDKSLAILYKNAVFFVFPSLYEGFGIPVLEAFNSGCPVLLSNKSSLPEVGGDAAIYFNPYDKADMLDKFELMYYNNDLRAEMSLAGLKRVKEFSWEKTTKEHYDVYKALI